MKYVMSFELLTQNQELCPMNWELGTINQTQ